MADKVGLAIIDVEFNDVNGGSFSVTAAKQGSRRARTQQAADGRFFDGERSWDWIRSDHTGSSRSALRRAAQIWLSSSTAPVRRERQVCALGASTKGNVLLQYCGITENRVAFVGEVNETKFGCFTPGTLIPIVPEDELLATNPDYLIMLPWHFRAFFEKSQKLKRRNLVFPLPSLEVVPPA